MLDGGAGKMLTTARLAFFPTICAQHDDTNVLVIGAREVKTRLGVSPVACAPGAPHRSARACLGQTPMTMLLSPCADIFAVLWFVWAYSSSRATLQDSRSAN